MVAGYVEETGAGQYEGTAEVSSPAMEADLACLQETGRNLAGGAAADLSSNIALVSACMEALPGLLAGEPWHALLGLARLQWIHIKSAIMEVHQLLLMLPAQAGRR